MKKFKGKKHKEIIIKEYNTLLDHAKEELNDLPGNLQIKYHNLSLIKELMVVAVDLGIITEDEKNKFEEDAEEKINKL